MSESSSAANCNDNPIYLVRSQDHRFLTVTQEQSSKVIEYGSVNGKPTFTTLGADGYQDMIGFYQNAQQPLMTKVHFWPFKGVWRWW